MRTSGRSRRGAALVEFAVCIPVFVMLLFSIFEFGRLYFTRHVMDAAAREAVRFAIVNADYGTTAQVQAVANSKMAMVKNYFVGSVHATDVFWVDGSGSERTPYNNAPFGDPMGVRVSGNYRPLFPAMFMNNQTGITLNSTCYMLSEGN